MKGLDDRGRPVPISDEGHETPDALVRPRELSPPLDELRVYLARHVAEALGDALPQVREGRWRCVARLDGAEDLRPRDVLPQRQGILADAALLVVSAAVVHDRRTAVDDHARAADAAVQHAAERVLRLLPGQRLALRLPVGGLRVERAYRHEAGLYRLPCRLLDDAPLRVLPDDHLARRRRSVASGVRARHLDPAALSERPLTDVRRVVQDRPHRARDPALVPVLAAARRLDVLFVEQMRDRLERHPA